MKDTPESAWAFSGALVWPLGYFPNFPQPPPFGDSAGPKMETYGSKCRKRRICERQTPPPAVVSQFGARLFAG